MGKRKDYSHLVGEKINSLTVMEVKSIYCASKERNTLHFICRCDCGKEYTNQPYPIIKGIIKSCGCSRKQRRRGKRTHGMSKTRFYRIWKGMFKRCYSPNEPNYNNYGGRGIEVCENWHEFLNFKNDMYESYLEHVKSHGESNTSIERKDVNGNYTPENCTWATRVSQSRNTRAVPKFHWKGKERSLAEIAEMENINYSTLRQRFIYNKMPLEKAIDPKPLKRRNNMTLYDYKGEKLTMTEICRLEGKCIETVRHRIKKLGMSIDEAINTPKIK